MKRVFKYPLGFDGRVLMPAGAEVLSVGDQHGAMCLWALVDPDAPTADRRFVIHGTGHLVDDAVLGRFIGTVQQFIGAAEQFGGELVWHVWEAC